MNEGSIYKVLTLKEIIEQVYSHNCGYARPTTNINHDVALYLYSKTPDSTRVKHEFKFKSQREALDFYNAFRSFKFIATQIYNNDYDMYEIMVSYDAKVEFKFINKTPVWQ